MIVYERDEDFVLIKQHDHSLLSGQICNQWNEDYFHGQDRWDEVMLAIREHDRCWIDLDDTPLWNDTAKAPFSFIDLPFKIKIPFYKKGIDSLEKESKYAALLCSMHFGSFFIGSRDEAAKAFLEEEQLRQDRLKYDLHICNEKTMEQLDFHFKLLQFGDDCSLYLCMQEPGVSKQDELSWFREGFKQQFPMLGRKIVAYWIDSETVSLHPFPLGEEWEVSFRLKFVKKADILELGLAKAYEYTAWNERRVTLVR